jgi:glycosyltransferase involved in cell wall biosynthesis
MQLSCLIPTRNHAGAVEQRMKEIAPFVDEFVVAHDGCPDDNTCEVAHARGAAYIQVPFMGYCEPAMVAGLARATGDWVLICADDEEYLPPCLVQLRELAQAAERAGADAYALKRLEKGLGFISKQLYFFKRVGRWFTDLIHMHVQGTSRWLETPLAADLIHHSVTDGPAGDPVLMAEKRCRYAAITNYLKVKYAHDPALVRHLSVDYRLAGEYIEQAKSMTQCLLTSTGYKV